MIREHYPKNYLYKRIVQAKLFIDYNYPENIDIDNISDEAYFSKYHFIRIFKKVYGRTPYQYLIFVRIERAIQLLHTEKSISAVCYAVGFESVSSFGSLFKRITGSTPSAFLEKQQQLQIQLLNDPLTFVPGCFVYKYGWGEK